MKIKEIKLLTNNIDAVRDFYNKILDLPIITGSNSFVTFQVGKSQLTFNKTETIIEPYYHFAFNITEYKVLEAINWINRKGIIINKVNNNDLVYSQTWNSDSIYFYDSVGNIVEFIARHNQKNQISNEFNYWDLINISEIGLPARDVNTLSNIIQEQYKEQVYLSSDSLFAPIGTRK
ncbi:VOC family protein [Cohnella sp.]|uniref:VOC family protein n=1 Tax=Cohnella sp. TaxID=1883426 RepID=UPI003566E9DA